MTTTAASSLLATFENGVFVPVQPVNLPEHSTVELTLKMVPHTEASETPPGTREAFDAFLRHCRESPLNSGTAWSGRDELYVHI